MVDQLQIYDYNNPTLNNNSARLFSILSNNYPLPFILDDIEWSCISHYIFGKSLDIIPSIYNNSNKNKYDLSFPYEQNFFSQYNYSLYNVDMYTYINDFVNNNKQLEKLLTLNKSFYTSTNNIILNVMSSNEYNLGMYYNKIIFLKNMKNKAELLDLKDISIIELKKKLIYKIYIIIQGLILIMFSEGNFNTLESFENYKFDDILSYIENKYGEVKLDYTTNIYNIYEQYTNKKIEYFSIYDKIITNTNLKDHIVKLFIISNYQKYNNEITMYCKNLSYKKTIQSYITEFINLGEDPDDFDSNPIPYNLTTKDHDTLLNLSIKNLQNYKNKLHTTKVECPFKKLTTDKINNLYNFLKEIPVEDSFKDVPIKNIVIDKENDKDISNVDDFSNKINMNLEQQLVEADTFFSSSKTLIDDRNILSPLYNHTTIIDKLTFNNLIEYIYFNLFKNLLRMNHTNYEEKAYELLFVDNTIEHKNVNQLSDTYNVLFNKNITILFNKCITQKFKNLDFKTALVLSSKYKLIYIPKTNYFIKENIFGKLIEELRDDLRFVLPDNYIRIINLYIHKNKLVYNWIDSIIYKYCNMFVATSIIYNKFIDKDEYNYLIKEFYLKEINIDNIYIPPILNSFKYKINSTVTQLTQKYNMLFNTQLSTNFTTDIYSTIYTLIFLNIEHLYSYKQTDLDLKLHYLLLDTQNIELSTLNLEKIFIKVKKILSVGGEINNSLILSLILGKPILDENPIRYIQTNVDSQKLPATSDFYSNTKNNIYTFY